MAGKEVQTHLVITKLQLMKSSPANFEKISMNRNRLTREVQNAKAAMGALGDVQNVGVPAGGNQSFAHKAMGFDDAVVSRVLATIEHEFQQGETGH